MSRADPVPPFASCPRTATTAWLAVVDLARAVPHRGELLACLSAGERGEAGRRREPDAAERVLLRRGALRWVLGALVGRAPRDLRFVRGPTGKPALEGGAVRFSTSSSGDLFGLAVATDADVGLDLERRRRVVGWRAIAEGFLPAAAVAELAGIGDEEGSDRFLRLWTAKEAVDKWTGRGLIEREAGSADPPAGVVETFEVGTLAVVSLASASAFAAVESLGLPAPLEEGRLPWSRSPARPS